MTTRTNRTRVVLDCGWFCLLDCQHGAALQGLVRMQAERFSKCTGASEWETATTSAVWHRRRRALNRAVGQHWHIENKLPWVLDVGFHDDHRRKRAGHAAQNFSLMNRIACNLLQQDKTNKRGVPGTPQGRMGQSIPPLPTRKLRCVGPGSAPFYG